ncbi:MAG TPA: TonB-dependent receptor, partial [Steroidobacteraceae bacterium]|nr:TonB-dependent receptor [Steroidobacteraceae bacterium]
METSIHSKLGFWLGVAASAAPVVAADASRVSANVNAPTTRGPYIAEVLVTARRREERAHEVPLSLAVRLGEGLERVGSLRLQEIAPTVPNLSTEVLNPRQASVAIRGLGRNPANDGLEASAGVFVDGVYLGRPGMAVVDYFDVERIEVLRGPQGALFGKNTTAGLLNISTRAPTDSFDAYAQATMGNQSYLQLHGAISGPLIADRLSARLSAFTTRRDGFVTNAQRNMDLGEFDRDAVRAQLAWQPTESFDLRLIGDYSNQNEDGPGLVLVNAGITMEDGSIRPNNFLDRSARAGYVPQFEPFARSNVADASQLVVAENGGVAVHARWRIGAHTLTSISAWRIWENRPRSDSDFTPLDIQPQLHFAVSDKQLSTELRLTSTANGRFNYQLGAFVFAQDLTSEFVAAYGRHAADFLQPGLPTRALDGVEVRTLGEPETRSAAVFGHVNWPLAERLDLSAGLRWTTEEKEAEIHRSSSGGAPLAPGEAMLRAVRDRLGAPVSVKPTLDEDFTSGVLSLAYRIGENGLAYASAARGAKSGGVNVAIVPAGISQVLEPEV